MMLINNNATKPVNSTLLKKLMLFMTVSLLPFTQVTASELSVDQRTVSQGAYKRDLNEQQRKSIIETNKIAELPDQLSGKASSKTRDAILNINNQKQASNKANNSSPSQSTNSDYYANFDIYDATSYIQDDYDGDGYYETLSVTFDADIYSYTENNFGEVYALLYLSKNGGPWTHYFTTDNFIIEGDTELDEYEVISTFLSGYESDNYDVLIDLYEVGYSDIVATLSSDDSDALYALPIESAEYNEPYIEVVEVHSGSMYWTILILISILIIRRFSRQL
jgi:hypothetical protein